MFRVLAKKQNQTPQNFFKTSKRLI